MLNTRKRKQFKGNAANMLCVCAYTSCTLHDTTHHVYFQMSKNIEMHFHWETGGGHLQNFKSQCERESTRMALYSNYFIQKFIIETSLKYQGPNTSQHKNKNVKNTRCFPIAYMNSHATINNAVYYVL